jgi:serine/threonine protein kinase
MSEALFRLKPALSDRYRIERELGAGGMATVFRAHDLRHDRDVAIKVLHPDLAAMLGAQRFLAEITTTAKLQHPHILPLLDSGEADGLLFYVMPVVDGESLRARLTKRSALRERSRARSTTRTGTASSIATSSPRTSCCTTARRSSPILGLHWPCNRPAVRG